MTGVADTSQRHLEAMIDNAFGFIGLLSPEGTLLRANQAALDCINADASDVIGQPFWETQWWAHSTLLRERLRESIEIAAAGAFDRFEATHVTADGGVVEVDFSLTPVRDDDGRVIFLLPEGRDITGLKRTQDSLSAELLESREQMRAVVETAADAIITIDGTRSVRSFNTAAEKMFGYTAAEVIGQNVKMLMPMPYRDEHDGYIDRYLRTGKRRIIGVGRQATAVRKDGTVFPIELAVSQVDHHYMFTGIIRDISDRIDAEERLRLADRLSAIGTLAAGLGHDMNNILLPMRARLDVIEATPLPPQLREHFGAIRKTVAYLQDLADGLHLLIQDPKDAGSSNGTTWIPEWWDHVHTLLGRTLPKHVQFSASLPADLPVVPVPPHRLTQAVLNILVNAGVAVGDDGRVRLWADTEHDGAVVRVGITDNGCGMTPEIRRRALEPFFTTKTRGLGTGLGLSLVHSVISSAGGTIEIESEIGSGTTIVLRFPAAETRDRQERHHGSETGRCALVSIRDPRIGTLVQSMLEMAGLELVTVGTVRPPECSLWVVDVETWTKSSGPDRRRAGGVILIGPPPTDWDAPGAIVVEDPNDIDGLRAAVRAFAEGRAW